MALSVLSAVVLIALFANHRPDRKKIKRKTHAMSQGRIDLFRGEPRHGLTGMKPTQRYGNAGTPAPRFGKF